MDLGNHSTRTLLPGALVAALAGLRVAAPSVCPADDEKPREAKPRVVMIASKTDTMTSEGAVGAVRGQLLDLPVDFRVAWVEELAEGLRAQFEVTREVAEAYRAEVVLWADVSVSDQVFIYISEPGGGRILVRTVDFNEENSENRFEIMAIVISTLVEAIIEGGEIGVRPSVSSTPPRKYKQTTPPWGLPPPEPLEPEMMSTSLDGLLELTASYGVTMYNWDARLLHGGRLGVAVGIAEWARLFAAYRIQPSFEVENELVRMEMSPHPFELGLSARRSKGDWNIDIGIALLNDPLFWSIRAKKETIHPKPGRFRWLVAASPLAMVGWSPNRDYKFFLAVSADIYFNESPADVETLEGDVKVVDPWDVRPYLQLGAMFSLQ